MGKCVEATQGRKGHELVELLSSCRSVIADLDTTKEGIETIYCEGGVEIGRCDRCEIVQSRQTDRFI